MENLMITNDKEANQNIYLLFDFFEDEYQGI